MRRFILIISLLIIIFNSGKAQNDSDFRWHGIITSGISLPLGEFSKNELSEGSFAKTGLSLGLKMEYGLNKKINIYSEINFLLHPVDASALATAEVADDPFLLDLYVRSDPFSSYNALVGISHSLSINQKFKLMPNIGAGWMWAKTPYQLYKPEYYLVGPDFFEKTSAKDNSFVWKIGFDASYEFNKFVAIQIDASYYNSSMKFLFSNYSNTYEKKILFQYVDVKLGLVISLF